MTSRDLSVLEVWSWLCSPSRMRHTSQPMVNGNQLRGSRDICGIAQPSSRKSCRTLKGFGQAGKHRARTSGVSCRRILVWIYPIKSLPWLFLACWLLFGFTNMSGPARCLELPLDSVCKFLIVQAIVRRMEWSLEVWKLLMPTEVHSLHKRTSDSSRNDNVHTW
jgi:hypothetical protein